MYGYHLESDKGLFTFFNLVLKRKFVIPGDKPLVGIGYKYNAQNVLSFIGRNDAGITNNGIKYLSKYPEPFSNLSFFPC